MRKPSQERRHTRPQIEINCRECKRPRSRRGALVINLRGRSAFVCARCCAYLLCWGFGYSREEVEFFLTSGGAA
jgi:hypothetical protein